MGEIIARNMLNWLKLLIIKLLLLHLVGCLYYYICHFIFSHFHILPAVTVSLNILCCKYWRNRRVKQWYVWFAHLSYRQTWCCKGSVTFIIHTIVFLWGICTLHMRWSNSAFVCSTDRSLLISIINSTNLTKVHHWLHYEITKLVHNVLSRLPHRIYGLTFYRCFPRSV